MKVEVEGGETEDWADDSRCLDGCHATQRSRMLGSTVDRFHDLDSQNDDGHCWQQQSDIAEAAETQKWRQRPQ